MNKIYGGFCVLLVALPVHAGWLDNAAGMLDTASKATATAASATQQAAATTAAPAATTATSTATALLPMLTSSLGVTETQASGGMGSLLQLAQGTLGSSDYSTLSGYIPDSASLLAAAPQTTASNTSAAGLATSLLGGTRAGGMTNSLVSGAQTVAQFKSLGLSAAMIPQYIEVANQFLQTSGGQEAVNLFSKGVAGAL